MNIRIVWWGSSKSELQGIIPNEVEVGEGHYFVSFESLISRLTRWGLNIAIPSDFDKWHLLYIDEKFFK